MEIAIYFIYIMYGYTIEKLTLKKLKQLDN